MQVTETGTAGLKRELKVVIDQGELGELFQSRLGAGLPEIGSDPFDGLGPGRAHDRSVPAPLRRP